MSMPEISALCDEDGPAIAAWSFWVYCPIGVVLLLVRLMMLAAFACLCATLPHRQRRVPFRLLRRLLGIVVNLNMPRSEIARLTNRHIVASNHVSVFDTLAVLDLGRPHFLRGTALRRESLLTPYMFGLVELVSGVSLISSQDRRRVAGLFRSWQTSSDESSLYIPAEMTINNGKGLFRFHPTLLGRGAPVVPLALKLTTSLGLVAHPLMSGGVATLVRLLMVPRLTFDVAYLPALHPSAGEDGQVFADRVQQAIADHLGIPATTHTVEAKRAYRDGLRRQRRSA